MQTALRFLRTCDAIELDQLEPHITPAPERQAFIEVTDAITIKTSAFEFVEPYYGLEVIPDAGTVLGRDGDEEIRTPHDNCVLIMPSRRLHPGHTAVRFGRFIH